MSMNATDASGSAAATLRATVLLPEPDPPATPDDERLHGLAVVRSSHVDRKVAEPAGQVERQSVTVLYRRGPAVRVKCARGLRGRQPKVPRNRPPWPLPGARSATRFFPMRIRTSLALVTLAVAASCARPARGVAPPPASLDLVVAATTDVHGRLRGWDYETNVADPARGLARAATIVDSLRAAAPGRVVLVDAGDLLQGNSARLTSRPGSRRRTQPHPVVAAMNAMRYDAAAIGNHEFNYGLPFLERTVAAGELSRSSPPTRTARTAAACVPRLDDRRARRGVASASSARRRPAPWSGTATTFAAGSSCATSCPRCAERSAEARAAGADVVVVTMHCGLERAVELRHRQHRAAERERGGARRTRGAGRRPDRRTATRTRRWPTRRSTACC